MMRKDKLATALMFISLSSVCISQYSLNHTYYVTMLFFGILAIATMIMAIMVITGEANL